MRLPATLAALILAAGVMVAAPASVAGPDCRKTPNAGPCRPKPTPSPTATQTPAPTPTATATAPPGALTPAVDRTCATDVTAALNAWLATVPDGSIIDLAGGCYLVQGTIQLNRRNGLTFDGNGATVKATINAPDRTDRSQINSVLGSNLTLRNLTLEGSNANSDCADQQAGSCYDSNREFDHNLHIRGTAGVLVDHVRFRHAWGDAVSLSPGGSWDAQGVGAVMATDVTVQNSTVDTTGRMAFACTGCKRFTVADNTITNVGYHVVDVEVEGAVWTGDVTLLRNHWSNTYLTLLSATTGAGTVKRGPFVVRDNVHDDAAVVCGGEVNIGAGYFRSGDVTITGNVLWSYLEDVNVENADSATITGNTGRGGNGGCGVNAGAVVTDSGPTTVTGNAFTNVAQVAALTRTPAATVCGNSLNGSAFDQPRSC